MEHIRLRDSRRIHHRRGGGGAWGESACVNMIHNISLFIIILRYG